MIDHALTRRLPQHIGFCRIQKELAQSLNKFGGFRCANYALHWPGAFNGIRAGWHRDFSDAH